MRRRNNPITPRIAKLKRQKRWPRQMQRLYDYFADAEDPRAQAEELLYCCGQSWMDDRSYRGRVDPDIEEAIDEVVDRAVEQYDHGGEALEELQGLPRLWDALLELRDDFADPYLFPEELPSWWYLSPSWGQESYDWLIHFSDDAYDIAGEGFCRGVPYPDKLGLTTHLDDFAFDVEGYNFAYPAGVATRYGFIRGAPKYGKRAVLFRAPYMLFDHFADGEPQAIFWGPSARDIVVIDFDHKEPVLEVDPPVLVDSDGNTVAVLPDDRDLADGLEEEHGGEWTEYLEFKDVEEMLEWLEGSPISGIPRLKLLDPLSKPSCVIRHRKAGCSLPAYRGESRARALRAGRQ